MEGKKLQVIKESTEELELDFDINEFLERNMERIKERGSELELEGFSFRIPSPGWEDLKDYLYPW